MMSIAEPTTARGQAHEMAYSLSSRLDSGHGGRYFFAPGITEVSTSRPRQRGSAPVPHPLAQFAPSDSHVVHLIGSVGNAQHSGGRV